MIQKIKRYMYMLAGTIMLALPGVVSTAVATATPSSTCNQISTGIANGINQATGTSSSGANAVDCSSSSVNGNTIGKAAKGLVNVFSIIVGVVAVVMIIYGGFRYITSGGDSGRVGNAKNSLIYAIVGLVIVALAQLIVHFVLGQTTSIQSNVTG
ncbi:MAG TPA: pilin [Candidatus Dormibacteraeota bacterium]|nr:pilin [Candidatus Dormibacteraeota bacterium]